MNSITMHRFGFRMLVTAIALIVGSSAVHAQLSEFDRLAVAAELRAMSGSLSAENLPNLSEAKDRVLRANDAMNRYLSMHSSPENWAAWLKYIDAGPLIEAIAAGKEEPRDLAEMGRVALALQQRLVGLVPGLERQALRDLRQSVDQLVNAIRHYDSDRSLQVIGKQMTSVAERIEKLEGVPTPDDEAVITALIGVLQDSGQATTTSLRLRNLFAKPNITVWVSEGVVQRAVQRKVDEQTPVNDCILGTRLVGDARLTGICDSRLATVDRNGSHASAIVGMC